MENGFQFLVRFPNGQFKNPFGESWRQAERRDLVSRIVGLGLASVSDLNSKTIWDLKHILEKGGFLYR